jgi:NADH:ubiquinone oxidoreductase subunit 6 (subunit J)
MFRFWFRESAGWLLILIGLWVFGFCLWSLTQPPAPGVIGLLEAPFLTIIGIFVFRGGIHLLKVAVAARISMSNREDARKQPTDQAKKNAETPWDW